MRRIALLVLLVLVLGVVGVASGDACPPKSQNPGGTPPSCGKQKPNPCPESGVVSGTVRTNVEPLDPTGGHANRPDEGGVVHRVNCTIVQGLLNL